MHMNIQVLALLAAVESSLTATACGAVFIASDTWLTAAAFLFAAMYRCALLLPPDIAKHFAERKAVQRICVFCDTGPSGVARIITGYVLLGTAAVVCSHDSVRLVACAGNFVLSVIDDVLVRDRLE